MTQNEVLTAGAVVLAMVAVVYAFKRPDSKGEATRAGQVQNWALWWDQQMAGLDLSANMADYNGTLAARGFGFTL